MVMHLVLDSPVVMARSSSSRFPFFFSFFTRLCKKDGYEEGIRPNGLMEDGAKKRHYFRYELSTGWHIRSQTWVGLNQIKDMSGRAVGT